MSSVFSIPKSHLKCDTDSKDSSQACSQILAGPGSVLSDAQLLLTLLKTTKKVVLDLMPQFLETSFIESLYVADSIKNKMQKMSI